MSAAFPTPSLAVQLAELKRERMMRNRVYPHLVATRKLSQSAADYQCAALDAAIKTIEAVLTAPRDGAT